MLFKPFTEKNTEDQRSKATSPKCRAKEETRLEQIPELQPEGTEAPLKGFRVQFAIYLMSTITLKVCVCVVVAAAVLFSFVLDRKLKTEVFSSPRSLSASMGHWD